MDLRKSFIFNLILSLLTILILLGNYYFLNATAFRIGEFIAHAAMISIGIWMLTLLIPKKFYLYRILSSSSFIFIIPLIYSLIFTYNSYRISNEINKLKANYYTVSEYRTGKFGRIS